jgi:restriction system protein
MAAAQKRTAAMIVPSYQELLQPMLKVLSAEGDEMSKSRIVQALAMELGLSEDAIQRRLPSDRATVLEHNIEWARSHLHMQGLVEGSLDRGLRLTARGWSFAGQNYPELLRQRFGSQIAICSNSPEAFDNAKLLLALSHPDKPTAREENQLLKQLRGLNDELALQLIDRVCRQSPAFFELLVIDLLLAMGYGGSCPNLAQRLGRSGDGGVDGVVAMDELGLDLLYLQAKRYRPDIPVPVSAVRDFVGSLDSKRAMRGVYFTTSFFPASAHDYVGQSSFRVVLVDGRRLAHLMMQYNVGVRVKEEIKLRRIDESYFAA